jgi:hypothetical protein
LIDQSIPESMPHAPPANEDPRISARRGISQGKATVKTALALAPVRR